MTLENELESSLRPFGRRTFLKASIAVGVGVSTILSQGCSVSDSDSQYVISDSDMRVLSKLSNTMFPDDPRIFPISKVPMQQNIDHLLKHLSVDLLNDLSAGIKLFNYGATILGMKLETFVAMNQEDATEYANQWQNGNEIQRGLLSGLKKLLYTAYWRDSRTWSVVDFDGPVSDKWGLPSLGNAPMPLA